MAQVVLAAVLAQVALVAAEDATPTPDPKKLKSQADRLFRAEKFHEVQIDCRGLAVLLV